MSISPAAKRAHPHPAHVAAMRRALALAADAAAAGEIPVGAVLLDAAGRTVAEARNCRRSPVNPAGHAEILALQQAASALGDGVLGELTLVVTLEPCAMCAGAILAARVGRVVFGAWDEKGGCAGSVYDLLRDGRLPSPVPEVISGVLEDECAAVLREFFEARR